MKNEAPGWAQFWSCGGTLSALLLPLTTTYSHWWWLVILIFASGVASAIWFIVWPWLLRMRTRLPEYRLRWPIERKLGWPHVVPLAGRIHHVRSYVDFHSLESDRTFQVTLKLLNSSAYNLQIESVTGHT